MASAELAQSIFDVTNTAGAQFVAMLMGAVLASGGGFCVAWMLDRMERKRQERSIALVCLDLLASLGVMTNLAKSSRGRGAPYGPLTMRLVRGCMRDLDVYERNRERIADISDPVLRAEIYQCMTRLALSVDGVVSETESIARLDEALALARTEGDKSKTESLAAEREERSTRRDNSFDFMMETAEQLGSSLARKLRVLARAESQSIESILAANNLAAPPQEPRA
jgi:hypothetical protein